MKALLSNDDGYLALGLQTLYQCCQKHFDYIQVVAPDRNCSGASSSITLRKPLYTHRHSNGFISIEGTPSDCVHLALSGLLEEDFDIVISGINHGANLGDDVIYSGTVAAAIEGRFLGLPSIAISLASTSYNAIIDIDKQKRAKTNTPNYQTAEYVIDIIINKLKKSLLPKDIILNVNIPDIALSELKGIQSTRLGFRHKSEAIIQVNDNHHQSAYWIGPAGKSSDNVIGTDFYAIEHGFASVTALQIDLTRHDLIVPIESWLTS